jgi:hypothetical protein
VDYVFTQAKIAGRKKRTRIRDQQNGTRSKKGDIPSTILWKQELNMDGHTEINSKLKTHLFGSQIRCNSSFNSTLRVVKSK